MYTTNIRILNVPLYKHLNGTDPTANFASSANVNIASDEDF